MNNVVNILSSLLSVWSREQDLSVLGCERDLFVFSWGGGGGGGSIFREVCVCVVLDISLSAANQTWSQCVMLLSDLVSEHKKS